MQMRFSSLFLLRRFFTIFVVAQLLVLTLVEACYPQGASTSVSAEGDTYVCLVLSPLTWGYTVGSASLVGKYLRIPTKVKADQFSRINVFGAWNSTTYTTDALMSSLSISAAAGNGVGVSVSSMGISSYQKAYRLTDSTSSKTFPLLMVLITVDMGKVVSITWDDTCKWCPASKCLANTYDFNGAAVSTGNSACWVSDTTCGFTTASGSVIASQLCDLQVYVAWTGIDSAGRYFESAAKRFSRLLSTQVTNYTATLAAAQNSL